jgi:hypothetical protein
MKFLKGFALFILGTLLFLSLFIFGIAFMLNQTALNPHFITSEVNKLDINSLAEDILADTIGKQAPSEEGELAAQALRGTIADLEPWLKEQTAVAVNTFYDYLEGRDQSLSLRVSLEPVKDALRENMREVFLQSPPAELAGLTPAELEQAFNAQWPQFAQEIPSTFELDEGSIPPDVLATLGQARQYISYFNLGFTAMIGFILLLILLIILVHRNVRGSTRGLGINFLICGVFSFALFWLAKNWAGPTLLQADMPTYIQTWLPQLLSDTLAPLQMYSIGLAAAGVVLIIVSVAYKPRPAF